MGCERVSVTVEKLTPEFVADFKQYPALPGERTIKKARVTVQREAIASQTYRGVDWATVLDKSTGIIYRANGQHSSGVLSNLDGLKFPTRKDGSPLLAVVEHWEMDDIAIDGMKMFDSFDRPTSVRSNGDRITMVAAGYPDIRHLQPRFLISVVNACEAYRAMQDDYEAIPSRYRGEELLDDAEVRSFALFLAPFHHTINKDFIRQPKVMGIAFAGWMANRKAAIKLWSAVFLEEEDVDPDVRQLVEALKEMRIRTRKGQKLQQTALKIWKRFSKSNPNGKAPEPSDATQPTQTAQSA